MVFQDDSARRLSVATFGHFTTGMNMQQLRLASKRLRDLQITGEGLIPLVGLIRLRVLDLTGSPIGDGDLPYLARFGSLEWLNLERTRVTREGVASLRSQLSTCNISISDDSEQ
jgi:hypothetical protein